MEFETLVGGDEHAQLWWNPSLTSRCPTMQKCSGRLRPQVEETTSRCARPISRSPVAG